MVVLGIPKINIISWNEIYLEREPVDLDFAIFLRWVDSSPCRNTRHCTVVRFDENLSDSSFSFYSKISKNRLKTEKNQFLFTANFYLIFSPESKLFSSFAICLSLDKNSSKRTLVHCWNPVCLQHWQWPGLHWVARDVQYLKWEGQYRNLR